MTKSREIDAEVLRLHYGEHWPVGTIARQLGLHADVVRRAIGRKQGVAAPGSRPLSVLAPYYEFVEQTLRQYPTLRSTRLYDMLRARGYPGSPRTVREYVAKVRPQPKTEAYLRLEVLPGEHELIVGMRRSEKSNLKITTPEQAEGEFGVKLQGKKHEFAVIGTAELAW